MIDALLNDAKQSGLFHATPARRRKFESVAQGLGFAILHARIEQGMSTATTLRELGQAFHFPAWYGANFDALLDCLSDPDWQPANGHLLLIDGLDALRQANPDDFATLIDVLRAAVEARCPTGKPFWILLETSARGIPALPEA